MAQRKKSTARRAVPRKRATHKRSVRRTAKRGVSRKRTTRAQPHTVRIVIEHAPDNAAARPGAGLGGDALTQGKKARF